MNKDLASRILNLREKIVTHFTASDWAEVGLLTGMAEEIDNYPRLLRSLNWGDEDYSGNVIGLLKKIAEIEISALGQIEEYVEKKYPEESHFVSAKPAVKKITFAPHVFQVPDVSIENDLVAVMMPFKAEFTPVQDVIRGACSANNLRCLRADDIWQESIIIQEIFNLIFRARIVVVDFTNRNPNVMYETGIAHTLGKLVIPISQSIADVPFDMAHHRVLKYYPNQEGLKKLAAELTTKLSQISQ